MSDERPVLGTLGLGGDGDEIVAIEAVERAFGVRFDQSDAGGWATVGDVFASLQERMGASPDERQSLWPRFVHTLGEGAALCPDDVRKVAPETKLLIPPLDVSELFRAAWRRLVR